MRDDLKPHWQIIQETVASEFGLQVADLTHHCRKQSIAMPRQIAMYLTRRLTACSLKFIGMQFGSRHHTTVLHAHQKISCWRKVDRTVSRQLDRLEDKLSISLNVDIRALKRPPYPPRSTMRNQVKTANWKELPVCKKAVYFLRGQGELVKDHPMPDLFIVNDQVITTLDFVSYALDLAKLDKDRGMIRLFSEYLEEKP